VGAAVGSAATKRVATLPAILSASSGKVKPPKFEPPPTQPTITSGWTPALSSWAFSSRPMTVWWSSTWLSTLPSE
jgi:hypothetical protein